MKRLFEVSGEYFETKAAAKVARGAVTKEAEGKSPPQYKHAISYGPDHWKRGGAFGEAAPAAPAKRTRKKKVAE